jgi:hypothetical protein
VFDALSKIDTSKTKTFLKEAHKDYMKSKIYDIGAEVYHYDFGHPWV